jgi:hypothetical protein
MSDQSKSRFLHARKLSGSILIVCASIYLSKYAPIQIVQAMSHSSSQDTTLLEQDNAEGNLIRFEIGNPVEKPSIWNFVRKNPFSILNNDSYLMSPINAETESKAIPYCSLYENSLFTFANDYESWIYSGEPFGKAATTPSFSESSTLTPTDTLTPSETLTPSKTRTPTWTPTATDPATYTSTSTLTETATETLTPTLTHTNSMVPTITNTLPTLTTVWTHTPTPTQTLLPTLTVTAVKPGFIIRTATPSGSWFDQFIKSIPTLNWFPTKTPTATMTVRPTSTKISLPDITPSYQESAPSGKSQPTMTLTITPLNSERPQQDEIGASVPFWLILRIGGIVVILFGFGIFRLRKFK